MINHVFLISNPMDLRYCKEVAPQMAGDATAPTPDTRQPTATETHAVFDTVHTRQAQGIRARKGTPTAMHAGQRMPSLELSHQGRRGEPGRSRPKPPLAHVTHTGKPPVTHSTHIWIRGPQLQCIYITISSRETPRQNLFVTFNSLYT